jgi:hypothetical protein
VRGDAHGAGRGGRTPWLPRGGAHALAAVAVGGALCQPKQRKGSCMGEKEKGWWLWRLGVGMKNSQAQGKSTPIYRSSPRVRVFLSGPNGLGWAGPKYEFGLR